MIKAIVLLSGGMDSTIAFYWAKERFEIEAITFDYGQRHKIEIESAQNIAKFANVKHKSFNLSILADITESALTQEKDIFEQHDMPNTFVPGRNILFFTLAASYGYSKNINNYVGGMCETDFSGYPDCRRATLDCLENTLTKALDKPVIVHTPLMYQTKAESLNMAQTFDDCMDALALSHTCYLGKRPACGTCPACQLRLKGFKEANLIDSIEYENGT